MKFEMGRAWSDATALLGANRQVVLIVAGVFFFLPYLALILLLPEYATTLEVSEAREPGNMSEAFEELRRVYGEIWWALLITSVLQGIGMLGLLALLTDRNRPTVGEALAKGAKLFLPYIAAQLLIAMAVVLVVMVPVALGAAAGPGPAVIAGLLAALAIVYLLTKFSLSTPVIVIDQTMNPIAALARSWKLTKGNSLRLFLFYALLFVVLIVISMVLGLLTGAVGVLAGDDGALILNGLLNAILNLVALTVILAVLAAVHRQLSGVSTATVGETFE